MIEDSAPTRSLWQHQANHLNFEYLFAKLLRRIAVGTQNPIKAILLMLMAAVMIGCDSNSDRNGIEESKHYIERREYSAAIVELKSVLQKEPTSGEARYLLGSALLNQGALGEAVLELKKAEELGFVADLLIPRLAHALVLSGKAKEVIDSFAKVQLDSPASKAELSTALALAFSRLGRRPEADASLAQALAADPAYPWALLTKARVLVGQGKLDEALAFAERARASGGSSGEIDLFRGMVLIVARRQGPEIIKAFEAAATDPTHFVRARIFLAEYHMRRDDLAAAKAQLSLLQKNHEKLPQTLFLDAVVSFEEKNFARAESIVDTLLRLAPNNTRALVLGGAASLRRGSLVAAEAKLGKVVQTVQGAVAARRLLAETYLRMGQSEKALAALRPLLDLANPDAAALALGAQAHLMKGDAERAEEMFVVASKRRPDDPRIRTSLALIELARGNANEAFDELRVIAQSDTGDTADLVTITSRLRRREFDEAIRAIDLLEKKPSGKLTASFLRGLALREKGDLPAARTSLEAALKLSSVHQASMLELAKIDEAEGKVEDAKARLTRWIEARPKEVPPRMALLDIQLRQNATPTVLLAGIDEAIRVAGSDPAPHVAKVVQLLRLNQGREAILAAQVAVAALPDQAVLLDVAGQAYEAGGDHQNAISTFNKLASLAPGTALPHLRLAVVHTKRGNEAAAASSLKRAFETEPLSTVVHRQLLTSAMRSSNFAHVTSAARELQRLHADRAAGFELEGEVMLAQRRWEAAADAFRKAIGRGAGTRTAIKTFDALSVRPGRQSADVFAKDWLSKHPNDASFLAFLGDRARAGKDYVSAERHYRKSMDLQPSHGGVLNNMAWTLGQMGRPAEGLPLAERAVKLYPNLPEFADTLAGLLAAIGRTDEAIGWQQRALALRRDDFEMALRLARMLIDVGRKQEAKGVLTGLPPGNPGSQNARELQRLLKLAS